MVGLEDVLIGLDGDGKGLGGKSGLHLSDIIGRDESVSRHIDGGGALLIVSTSWDGTGTRDVGVGRLKLSLGCLPVLESLVLPATVASVVGSGARNKLLLGERLKGSSADEVFALKSTSGGERPAGTALALILDGGDTTSSDPVDTGGVDERLVVDLVLFVLNSLALVAEHARVLSVSPVRELVVTKGVGETRIV